VDPGSEVPGAWMDSGPPVRSGWSEGAVPFGGRLSSCHELCHAPRFLAVSGCAQLSPKCRIESGVLAEIPVGVGEKGQ
jgi:hypothetical protein